jgi:hypothetical protein
VSCRPCGFGEAGSLGHRQQGFGAGHSVGPFAAGASDTLEQGLPLGSQGVAAVPSVVES